MKLEDIFTIFITMLLFAVHLQNSTDLFCTLVLFLSSFTIVNHHITHSSGWVGELECRIWNSEALLWAGLNSSTWNLVCLAVERFVNLF